LRHHAAATLLGPDTPSSGACSHGALARQAAAFSEPVQAAIRVDERRPFVHDQLELAGKEVAIADAQKVKGPAALACKTDRIDA
jgi:transposase